MLSNGWVVLGLKFHMTYGVEISLGSGLEPPELRIGPVRSSYAPSDLEIKSSDGRCKFRRN